MCIRDRSEFFYDKAAYEKRLTEFEDQLIEEESFGADAQGRVLAEELHEVVRLNEIDARLKSDYGLELNDYLLKTGRTVSGEALPTKFEVRCGEDRHDVPSLGAICQAIRQIGGKGIEIKRFKGLGEMNSDQLWSTTMDPSKRTLLLVKLEDAGEADRLFSILMGDDVEKRRNFIRDHALEVQNLDV
jgi:DNA gyrase subunit B